MGEDTGVLVNLIQTGPSEELNDSNYEEEATLVGGEETIVNQMWQEAVGNVLRQSIHCQDEAEYMHQREQPDTFRAPQDAKMNFGGHERSLHRDLIDENLAQRYN